MSKKTKRLEKENLILTRKHDLTNHNILQMAEERTRTTQELEASRRKNAKLTDIIKQMQEQGRGLPAGVPGVGEASSEVEYAEGEVDPSDGSEFDYEDEEGSEEYDEDTEEEVHPEMQQAFGPVPPPPPPQAIANGVSTNGVHH
jgi:hypothetical protein